MENLKKVNYKELIINIEQIKSQKIYYFCLSQSPIVSEFVINKLIANKSNKKFIQNITDIHKLDKKSLFQEDKLNFIYTLKKDTKQIKNIVKIDTKYSNIFFIVDDKKLITEILNMRLTDSCIKIDLRFLPYRFKLDFTLSLIEKQITQSALRLLIKKLGSNYEEYPNYINILNVMKQPTITKEIVKNEIPNLEEYEIMDLVETLVMLNKKTKHIKSLEGLLTTYSPEYIHKALKNIFSDILFIKKLYMEGYLSEYEYSYKQIYERFNRDILKNRKRVKQYIEYSKNVTLKELVIINNLFSTYKPSEDNLYKIVLSIYLRRNTNG